jgi:hypothetical protein
MKKLLSESSIIKNKQKYIPKKGVYFLILKNKIIYVGSSINIDSSVNNHLKKRIPFDSFSFIKSDDHQLLKIKYIIKFNPPYNSFVKLDCKTALSANIIKLSIVKKALDSMQYCCPEYKKINSLNFLRYLNKYPIKPIINSNMFNHDEILNTVKQFYKLRHAEQIYKDFVDELHAFWDEEIDPDRYKDEEEGSKNE